MESSQWEHCNHLFCHEVSLLSDLHCQFRGVGLHLLRKNYPIKLEIKDITDIVRSALYLDLRLEIDNEGRIPVFIGVRATRSLVLCVCLVDRCLSFCTYFFGHDVFCSSSIYGFWLPLWYLQNLLKHFLLSNIELYRHTTCVIGSPSDSIVYSRKTRNQKSILQKVKKIFQIEVFDSLPKVKYLYTSWLTTKQ
jgi:hypothetical protein